MSEPAFEHPPSNAASPRGPKRGLPQPNSVVSPYLAPESLLRILDGNALTGQFTVCIASLPSGLAAMGETRGRGVPLLLIRGGAGGGVVPTGGYCIMP